jgi:replicative DNA helicase
MELKKAAIEHDVPIVLICHTRKVNDKVEGKRRAPELEDLKDTSAIAQDADIVLFVYRNLEDENADNDEVIVALAKNRNAGVFRDARKATFKSNGVSLHEETF